MKRTIFLNGKFIPQEEAKLPVMIPGFLHGFGLFETMRAHNNKIVHFSWHLKRISDSCKLAGMHFPYPFIRLRQIIKKAVKVNNLCDAYVRMTLWKADKGTDTLIVVKKYVPYSRQKYREGFSAGIAHFRQDENSFLSGLKTTNRILYELSFQEAKGKGFDEAIICNHRGYISEGARSNLFLAKDEAVFTPSLANGCLNGITRQTIFYLAKRNKVKIYEGNFTIVDLYAADESFLTNSLMGVMPLVSVERKGIGKGKCGRLAKLFIGQYNRLLR